MEEQLSLQGQSLQNKRVLSIDLASIMAGSGIRGQFEEKFKALIRDIEDEVSLLATEKKACAYPWHVGGECHLFH